MTQRSWKPGDVVVWHEGWRGRNYIGMPVRVIEDDERQVVVYIAEGTRFGFPPGGWPWGDAHPWSDPGVWSGHGVLILHPRDSAHTIWHFWDGPERLFTGWYVNLQAPFARNGHAFETHDHELDIWIRPDGSWQWKDEEKLPEWVERGRYTDDDVAAFRAEGERVLAEWSFPTGWEEWEPDPSWPVPELPDDWDA